MLLNDGIESVLCPVPGQLVPIDAKDNSTLKLFGLANVPSFVLKFDIA